MPNLLAFFITFATGLAGALLLTPLSIRLGERWGFMAVPGGRRKHREPVSKLGIVPIFGAFLAAVLIAQLLPIPRFDPRETLRLTGLLGGAVVLVIAGVLDDRYDLKPFQQLVGQLIAAAIAILFQIFIESINNPLTGQQTEPWPYLVTVIVTVLWLEVSMNTVNWLDGLDGLASGVAFIASVMLFIHSAFVLQPAQTSVSLLPLALMGATLGFLLFNFYPARIFLGSGAPLLGYLLGTLSIIGGAKMATILMVMGLPLMDFAWQVFRRTREGRNPMSGDRGHLHFRLLDHGVDQRIVVSLYYVFCGFFGALTLLLESAVFKAIALGVMVALLIASFALIARMPQPASSSESSSPSG
ncbi:MAG: undecaprenyl/decaprenyl-phosphate alpha-N-acetylglucosaminyl 1-phosphate transferase [Chloroflexi bacterium]|nr:MAG: UDP-N-acetylglucosamine--undecaprenyl-phosphate N-acetylglucosamine-1-phosphate transferase [Chloroflexi bacterium OLB13]MBV6435868.1 putative undecaprenyl-phosphate N-acetylglucosaminyl 1-phosphate transferase [Anaerolineae bacterium]MCC6564141.1 undecaprenyl/decaprenyl-phosphate alpha-N-acetylglucosaminyl 1-phosphate transferase [Chloroflexota bacterium]MDL1917170.1 undecaprenyl/decaprenyl-phosphate alpha-N-acetylglucosaminyl 1-phosphate transferase [Anaerolineae bacterium CFX4]OQY868